ncbi:MAG TPA: hypothetical protein VF277_00470 [Steroidobacteraceae bacterium]
MSTVTAPVSDHARRTARRIAALLAKADALLITAGSGMSEENTPHDGYRILRAWAQAMPCGSFVVTTNVDGQFQQAGFTDWQMLERRGRTVQHEGTRACGSEPVEALEKQQQRFDAWLVSVRGKRVLVVEVGAGEHASSVRRLGEKLLERSLVSLARINPRATEADEPLHVLRLPASTALALIHESLPEVFGGPEAGRVHRRRPGPPHVSGKVHLKIGQVLSVDLGGGLVAPLAIDPFGQDEDLVFLERYAAAQTGWVAVPACGGLKAPGYTMTARVLGSSNEQVVTPGAAIVFVQAPDEQAVMTFGIARRRDDAPGLWQLLYSSSDRPLVALDFPAVPWVARRPAAGLARHPEALPYLTQFERVLARSYLSFLAFIDATQKAGPDSST